MHVLDGLKGQFYEIQEKVCFGCPEDFGYRVYENMHMHFAKDEFRIRIVKLGIHLYSVSLLFIVAVTSTNYHIVYIYLTLRNTAILASGDTSLFHTIIQINGTKK